MAALDDGAGWRLGAAPVMAEGADEARAAPPPPPLPDWIARDAAVASVAAVAPARRRPEQRVARGILIHRILQNLADLPAAEHAAHIAAAVRRAGHDESLAEQLKSLVADPLLAEILSADGHSEVSLIAQGPDGNPERRRIDRLVMTDDAILVADYKTDRDVPQMADDCNPEYLIQLATYREALRLAEPDRPMRFCLVYTEAPKLIMVPDALLDRMAALRSTRP
jgi:ATP-dependent helicase/nuclease subunit A